MRISDGSSDVCSSDLDDVVKSFHLHLVSDATGETINSVARACLVQFEGVEPVEHSWTLIRTPGQMDKVLAGIEATHGLVLYTMVNDRLSSALREGCRRIPVPCIPVMEPVIAALANFLDPPSPRPPAPPPAP